jgi:cell division protein ZapA
MKTVAAVIQGKEYLLACDAGQEQHLQHLVRQLNARADQLTKGVGKLSEPLLLLYTALMVADELHEANRENTSLRDELMQAKALIDGAGDDARVAALEEGMAETLHALASRIEGIAEKLGS